MLLSEWNLDEAKEVWQEEAREEVLELITQGYTVEQIKAKLDENSREMTGKYFGG